MPSINFPIGNREASGVPGSTANLELMSPWLWLKRLWFCTDDTTDDNEFVEVVTLEPTEALRSLLALIGAAGAPVTVTFAAPLEIDMATGLNFETTATANFALSNPVNATVGQSGRIGITQGGAGGFGITSFGDAWTFPGGTAPVLPAGVGARAIIGYYVRAAGAGGIEANFQSDFQAPS